MLRMLAVSLLLLVACVPVPTPTVATLEAPAAPEIEPLRAGDTIAVLPDDKAKQGDKAGIRITQCVREGLTAGLPAVRVLNADAARDLLFPWLEPGQVPRDDVEVRALVSHGAVAAKMREMRLRYVIVIANQETTSGDAIELVMAGMGVGNLVDRASARIIDIEGACCRSGGSARGAGVMAYGHYLIFGFVTLADTEGAACHALGDALLKELHPPSAAVGESAAEGRPSHAEKP